LPAISVHYRSEVNVAWHGCNELCPVSSQASGSQLQSSHSQNLTLHFDFTTHFLSIFIVICTSVCISPVHPLINYTTYVGKSVSELQIQVANYVFELSAGNCHR